jgi:hypothetical protein
VIECTAPARLPHCPLVGRRKRSDEGALFLDRLPTKSEADAIRSYCGIRKRAELSEESLAQLRERGRQLAETRRAA